MTHRMRRTAEYRRNAKFLLADLFLMSEMCYNADYRILYFENISRKQSAAINHRQVSMSIEAVLRQ